MEDYKLRDLRASHMGTHPPEFINYRPITLVTWLRYNLWCSGGSNYRFFPVRAPSPVSTYLSCSRMKRSKERVVLKGTEFEGTPRNETIPCPNLPFELSRAHQPHCREAHVRSQTSRSRSVHTSKGTKRIFDAKGFGKSFLFFESFRNEVKVLVK